MIVAKVTLLLTVLVVSIGGTACAGTGYIPTDNNCVGATDGNGVPTPNCMNIGSEAAPQWACARCGTNCDCQEGYYCRKTPGPTAGSCQQLSTTGKIGKPCAPFGFPGVANARLPAKGVDDELVCGAAMFDYLTNEFIGYEWLGGCVASRCYECSGGALSWALVIASQTTSVPQPGCDTGTGVVTNTTKAFYLNVTDTGSLVCPQRGCEYGKIVPETSWIVNLIPTGVIVGILVFVIFIFFGVFISCILDICGKKRYILKFASDATNHMAAGSRAASQADDSVRTQQQGSRLLNRRQRGAATGSRLNRDGTDEPLEGELPDLEDAPATAVGDGKEG